METSEPPDRAAKSCDDQFAAQVAELAYHLGLVAEQLRSTRLVLARASQQAERVRRQLAGWRTERPAGCGEPAMWPSRRSRQDPAAVRAQAGALPAEQLFEGYVALGGNLGRFEVDAFVHAGIDLPELDVAILAHAVWELTEL